MDNLTKGITIQLDHATYKQIEDVAERDRVSKGQVIREVLAMALDARANWQRIPKITTE